MLNAGTPFALVGEVPIPKPWFSGSTDVPLDFESALREHHDTLQSQVERMVEASTPSHRRMLFDQFSRALGGHFRAMDHAVIPALRAHGWRDVPSDILVGHANLKRFLADVLASRSSPVMFDERLSDFLPRFAAQREIEFRSLVPAINRLLDPDENRSLAAQVAAEFGLVFDRQPSAAEPRPANDLIDEARVVLSGFSSAIPGD
jgi:hypothetical protein